jgi:hypothetical protein
MSYASNAFGWFRRVAKPVVGHCTVVRQQHTFVQALNICVHMEIWWKSSINMETWRFLAGKKSSINGGISIATFGNRRVHQKETHGAHDSWPHKTLPVSRWLAARFAPWHALRALKEAGSHWDLGVGSGKSKGRRIMVVTWCNMCNICI